jgi:glycosyltransferase involved in cell wall biosynthesis
MKLSILICHLVDRAIMLEGLLHSLNEQRDALDSPGDVEILVDGDRGEVSTGAKRNRLLAKAQGDYIAFVDDDDSVDDGYCALILAAIETKPDCCGIAGVYLVRDAYTGVFDHSITHKQWDNYDHLYLRPPNHLNPVRRELALQAGFPECNHGEDKEYSMRLLPLLKTEVKIERPIYYYHALRG